MIVVLSCIALVLSVVVVILVVALLYVLKKTTFMADKDKDFVVFTIDMYIEYAKELDIHSETEHENIVKELNKIKDKHFNK